MSGNGEPTDAERKQVILEESLRLSVRTVIRRKLEQSSSAFGSAFNNLIHAVTEIALRHIGDCKHVQVDARPPSEIDGSIPCIIRWQDRGGVQQKIRFFIDTA